MRLRSGPNYTDGSSFNFGKLNWPIKTNGFTALVSVRVRAIDAAAVDVFDLTNNTTTFNINLSRKGTTNEWQFIQRSSGSVANGSVSIGQCQVLAVRLDPTSRTARLVTPTGFATSVWKAEIYPSGAFGAVNIGRSAFVSGGCLNMDLRAFEMYDRAMTDAELNTAYNEMVLRFT